MKFRDSISQHLNDLPNRWSANFLAFMGFNNILLALIGYAIPFIIIILLWVLDIPFLIGLLVTAICFIVISTTAKSIKQLSELKVAEIGLESVTICINNKMEEFHYSEIEDIVLVTDKGWNKNGRKQ